jgi:hypothetical protein
VGIRNEIKRFLVRYPVYYGAVFYLGLLVSLTFLNRLAIWLYELGIIKEAIGWFGLFRLIYVLYPAADLISLGLNFGVYIFMNLWIWMLGYLIYYVGYELLNVFWKFVTKNNLNK